MSRLDYICQNCKKNGNCEIQNMINKIEEKGVLELTISKCKYQDYEDDESRLTRWDSI